MPATVSHVLSATTPDDPAYEIRPSHWNSAHAITLNVAATEISALFSNKNGVSFGLDGTNITGSVNAAAGGLTNINVSGGTTSNNLSNVVFSNSNGLAFGLNGSTVTGSYTQSTHAHSTAPGGIQAGTQTATSGTVVFADSNGVAFGMSGSSQITASYSQSTHAHSTAPGGIAAGTQTGTSGTIAFVDSNGLVFGMSGSTAITGSYTQSTHAHILSLNATSNTTQSSSGTVDMRSITFAGAGIASVGITGGSVVISVPSGGGAGDGFNIVSMLTSTSGGGTAGATFSNSAASIGLMAGSNITLSQTSNTINIVAPNSSSLVAFNGLTISTAGSTISVGEIQASFYRQAGQISQAAAAQGNSLVSIQPFQLARDVVWSNCLLAGSWAVGSAANNSSAYCDYSASVVVYSRNGSTLSSVASAGGTGTISYSSNVTGSVTGVIGMTATCAQTTLTEGEYWIAAHVSTNNTATGGANTTALGKTVSMILTGSIGSAADLVKAWGGQTANSQGLIGGLGIISTNATRATIALSDYTATGTSAFNAPVFFELRNATFQI